VIKISIDNIKISNEFSIGIKGDKVSITVEGHSGKGAKGYDIVCAGISAVVQSAILAVTKIAGLKQNVVQREGYIHSEIFLKNESDDKTVRFKAIIGMMLIGIYEIKNTEPDAVEINYF
jgi:uncharacterized protein